MTFTVGAVLTAAQLNSNLRDNLNYLRSSASGNVATSESTASATFTALTTAGPAVTLTTDTQAVVYLSAQMSNSGTNHSVMCFDISGASTIAATDPYGIDYNSFAGTAGQRNTGSWLITGLTPGSNTFTAKYRCTGGTSTFSDRKIVVTPA